MQDSITQYSGAQIQRTNEARRQIDQNKEKQDAVNDKVNVEVTISEDLADGQSAKLDASLKLLGGDDIETTIDASQGGSRALQDYQRQLMLLEQQNKERLLMATQEQVPAATDHEKQYETYAMKKEQVQAAVTPKLSRDLKANQVTPRMSVIGADKGPVSAKKRRKRGQGARPHLSLADNRDVINGSGSNAVQAGSVEVSDHYLYTSD